MILLAALLLAIGLADFARPQDRPADRAALVRASVVGSVALLLTVWGAGLDWWWAPIGIVALIGWVASTLIDRVYPWPIVGLGVLVAAILAGSGDLPAPDGWLTDWYDSLELESLQGIGFEQFALAAGCLVFLVESANIVVRMVLAGTDAGVMATEQTLKGGRVLGPIERSSSSRWRCRATSRH